MTERQKSDYMVLTTADGIPLVREAMENHPIIRFERGLSPASIHFPDNQDRSYAAALINRQALIDAGLLQTAHPTYGDETRPAFDCARKDGSVLRISVGITHYKAFIADLERGRISPKLNAKLRELGRTTFKDQWAYFQQAIGVAGLVITKEGSIAIGPRTSTRAEYDGFFDSAAGYVRFPLNTHDGSRDVEHPESINPESDLRSIVEREFGITRVSRTVPVGFFGNPNTGEFDITYLVFVDEISKNLADSLADSIVFETRQRRKLEFLHGGFPTAQAVLRGEVMGDEDFMSSTWGALKSLRPEDFK